MTHELFTSAVESACKTRFPDNYNHPTATELCTIWSEVLEKIIGASMNRFFKDARVHVDLKPEMAVGVTNTAFGLAKAIVSERSDGKNILDINVDDERLFHLSAEGLSTRNDTTEIAFQALQRRYSERWEPKTRIKLEAEANPPTPKTRVPKAVKQNHFISSFFLKSYWAENNSLLVLKQKSNKKWEKSRILTAKWGHEDRLYSDRLEDRFSLIEGDAVGPIKKVLDCYPLNDPERNAFFGYLIVQKLRNPHFRRAVISGTIPVSVETVGLEKANDPIFQRDAYETIFENNGFYDEISRPTFWSKWLVLRSSNPVFVLPDTFCIMRKLAERQVLIAPITPKVCFVATDIAEQARRAVPYEVKDGPLPKLISDCLLLSANNQSVCHASFVPPTQPIDAHSRLEEAIEGIDRFCQTAEA